MGVGGLEGESSSLHEGQSWAERSMGRPAPVPLWLLPEPHVDFTTLDKTKNREAGGLGN